MKEPWLHENEAGVTLDLYLQPRASKNEIAGEQGDELKVRLTSPPVEGAANDLCRKFFAKLFRVAKSDVVLLAGERSRHKRLQIRGGDAETAKKLLKSSSK